MTLFEILYPSYLTNELTSLAMSKDKHILSYLGLLGIFLALRTWLVSDQQPLPLYWPHDDLLFVNWAKSLIAGNWLGNHTALSHVKVPGYSMWMAFFHSLEIPLLDSQRLLQLLVILLFGSVLILKENLSFKSVTLTSIVMLFSPYAFSFFQTLSLIHI